MSLNLIQPLALMALILAPTVWIAHHRINKAWQNHLLAFVVALVLVGAIITLIPR